MTLRVTELIGFGSGSALDFRYFRLNITATESGTDVSVGELKIFVDVTENPTSNMTTNTAPSPLVASASAENSPQLAFAAFDGTDDSGDKNWSAGAGPTQWLKIDLGAGNGIEPNSFKITARTGDQTHTPKTFTFEGSNTGSFGGEETVLKTVTNESAWSAGEERTYII